LIAIAPSLTAEAMRFMAPALTSPAAKMPGLQVSKRNGARANFHDLLKLS
jgi:hypothetical protein